MLWASSSKRIIDPGNRKVSSTVKEIRDQVNNKLRNAFSYQYGEWIESSGFGYDNTIIDLSSHSMDELQMADLACGYAEELFRKYGGEVHKLSEHFKRVFLNGKIIN